ncbi:MAG: glyoxalase [Anaerolineaceae bacterium]|nr:glyoxalase [Anaerolineaceae bacterium]
MSRVVHFEISVDDMQRAVQFYKAALGWEISKWDGPQEYWLVSTGSREEAGIDGGLMLRDDKFPPVVNTIDVSNLDEAMKKVVENGGKIAVDKMPVPGVGFMAYCLDTEGNMFGMMESNMSAE